MKRLFRHFSRRGQSGQALVVLAIGFIGLLGFVGIVTDVSLLFIRYSTMRRAVDAASVAAAGQMRRVVDSNPLDTIAQDEADSVANLNLAARQFIELYGLEPTNVLVETCRAQQVNREEPPGYPGVPAPLDWPWTPLDRNDVDLFQADGTPNPLANADDVARYQELCTEDELKLVRVTAQIEAPTIFMRLLGYDTITLTESAISQTAVIDVVLVFDVSESMLNETTYDDWDTLTPPQGVRYMPPYIRYDNFGDSSAVPPRANPWDVVLNCMQGYGTLAQCGTYLRPDNGLPSPGGLNYMIRSADPNDYYHLGDNLESFEPLSAGGWAPCNPIDPSGSETSANGQGPCSNGTGREEPREFCQVRGYTYTIHGLGAAAVSPALQAEYAAYYGANLRDQFGYRPDDPATPDNEESILPTTQFNGFVPMYNYFGCCNDPDGNGDFGDLICQPFREARDAASSFLARLDFLRGDRVAFVTFDRYATVIDPDGTGGIQSAMIETEYNLANPADPTGPPLRRGAQEVLSQLIIVKGEESTYIDLDDTTLDPDDPSDGSWNKVWDDGRQRSEYDFLYSEVNGNIHENPVYRSCPYDKAVTSSAYTNARTLADGSPRDSYTDPLIHSVNTVPDWYSGDFSTGNFEGFVSYEFRASCRGTNIGGALAAGSSTLYNTGRREGAVWIMVMLSDGAAGASNIVTRDGNPAVQPDPYNLTDITFYNNPLNALGTSGRLDGNPPPVDDTSSVLPAVTYGAFGLCPYGEDGSQAELLNDAAPPYCSDRDPSSRHYCGTAAQNPGAFALDIYPDCVEYYDVDDYARDWADWIGVADLPGATTGAGAGRVTDQLLPTIFTIGFGLNYDNGSCPATDYDCQRGINPPRQSYNEDYLGEELLRYIADVGDNFQIDNDYWQQDMGSRIGNSGIPGARGSCEEETPVDPGNPGGTFQPLPPMTSCGNYFVAASGSQLEAVFNEIASRMFTRLSQ